MTDDARDYFRLIQENRELVGKLGKAVLLNALKADPQSIMKIYRKLEMIESGKENLQSRIINNICVVVTGLIMLDKTLQAYDLSLESCTGDKINT